MSQVLPVTLPTSLTITENRPEWLNSGDNAWQLIAASLVGYQSVPGLIILYSGIVKKKWAVNSAFMALYAFAVVLLCWVLFCHCMAFDEHLLSIIGLPESSLGSSFLESKSIALFPNATYTFFQFAFAAITVVLLAGSLLGRMNFYAWMLFVPLWVSLSYTVGAFCIWGQGFLFKWGLVDFAGGYVIHLSSGVAGFTAAYWVGPRLSHDRQQFPPNNIIHMLGGAGFLWLGWSGFNGGASNSADLIASLAVLNTHLCTATSLSIWLSLDMIVYKKSSVIGAVQGMMTGLVCITPAAGLVEPWAAMLMGVLSGSLPWYTMMVIHKKSSFLQKVDDTLGVLHTHAVAGLLGGILGGILAHPRLMYLQYGNEKHHGLLYSFLHGNARKGLYQLGIQILGAIFITVWNLVVTSFICVLIRQVVQLRMKEEDLKAYAIWGDGEKSIVYVRRAVTPKLPAFFRFELF
ncbi:ammonium transporter Amt family protein [Dioscorea alata]|uniref:Ammonium transporter Amt family protein n=1 Tax=Dioscorea alata TaxID=55571 RepID=A0ACB7VF74_DIOAL|nr:ammonium transporter Amt family protein [Dioscorea alata]